MEQITDRNDVPQEQEPAIDAGELSVNHQRPSQRHRQDRHGEDSAGGLLERERNEQRGHTERDITQNENLSPTKVKGEMSPGGQMPSITLKGVSIKGQSKVQYEEAMAAAQSDAQSALSQEKVPRAYQGAVKDYFDDQKN